MIESPYLQIWTRALDSLKPHRLRTMRQFAEDEIILPDGPFRDERFRVDRQPLTGLLLDEFDNPYWSRFVVVGVRQDSKTLCGFTIPLMYHLFEIEEPVILGVPSDIMGLDKWRVIRPIIERSKYAEFLPKEGAGAEGGTSNIHTIRFGNGAVLKFMSGAARGKAREGYTSRVLAITETDGFDPPGQISKSKSRAANPDKISQMEEATSSYAVHGKPRIFMESTLTVATGRSWREYLAGSASRIAVKCLHCGQWVTQEREHLVGWETATNILEAGAKAALVCPACGVPWSEEDRRESNRKPLLVHRGQTVNADGAVVGDMPQTNTLGFRWNVANSLLKSTSYIAMKEWNAQHGVGASAQDGDGESADSEKTLLQYYWVRPYEPEQTDLTVIDHNAIMARVDKEHRRGQVPADAAFLTLGLDVGKFLCRWVVGAWRPLASVRIVDYGVIEVPTRDMDEDRAIVLALRNFQETVLKAGWPVIGGGGGGANKTVAQGLIDSGYHPDPVCQFCDEFGGGILFASRGYGTLQRNAQSFVRGGGGRKVLLNGEEYHALARAGKSGNLATTVEYNADYWKGWLQARLRTPMGQPGAALLFRPDDADPKCHLTFAKHLVAEKKVEEWVAGKGMVARWIAMSKNNHFLDASTNMCVAGHIMGARLLGTGGTAEAAKAQEASPQVAPEEGEKRREESGFNPLSSHRGRW